VDLRTRRDEASPSDWIRVYIDSSHDRRTAYEFAVNPVGVKQDRYWFGDTTSDPTWDAVWDVSVTTDSLGWKAEFRSPFSQLRFDPGRSDAFGFAVVREIGRLNETPSWPLITKSRPGFVSQFGELGGLTRILGNKRVEVMPYLVGTARTQPVLPGDPLVKSSDPGGSCGHDNADQAEPLSPECERQPERREGCPNRRPTEDHCRPPLGDFVHRSTPHLSVDRHSRSPALLSEAQRYHSAFSHGL
jgi:hypothetical protein